MEHSSEMRAPGPRVTASTLWVVLLALFGYAVLGGVLVVLCIACALLFRLLLSGKLYAGAVKLGFILVPLIWVILRSVWVRIRPPIGLALERGDAPRLFELIDRVGHALRAPRTDTVLLSDDLNAGVAHVPWLGMFGPGRNYLLIGLPLLQALTEPQLEAVLAHEFGHVSGKHTRFGAWVYRTRVIWARLAQQLESSGRGAPLRAFLHWYYPRFEAASLVVARAQELQADRESAELVGARTAADALIATHLQGRLLHERFWIELSRRNARLADPPVALFAETRALLTGGPAPELTRWMRDAMAEVADPANTHPALIERLRQLGQTERVPAHGPPASRTLLGAAEARLEEALNRWWAEHAMETWRERHNSLEGYRKRLRTLEEQAAAGQLPVEEAWERADLVEDFQGEAEAMPLFEDVLARAPDHAKAHLSVGRILLLRGDASARDHLERAARLDRQLEGPTSVLLGVLRTRDGGAAEAQPASEGQTSP